MFCCSKLSSIDHVILKTVYFPRKSKRPISYLLKTQSLLVAAMLISNNHFIIPGILHISVKYDQLQIYILPFS